MTGDGYQPAVTKTHLGGEQREFRFANGFGASVVRSRYSYGGAEGLFELAVLGPDNDLTYDTPITDDVIGWLSESEVQETLARIDALPSVEQPS